MLSILLIAATVFTTGQGKIVHLTLPDQPGVKSVELAWEGKSVPMARKNAQWETIVGVDLDVKPGEHAGNVIVTYDDARVERRPAMINIEAVSFPTTQLTVEDKYVELSPAN